MTVSPRIEEKATRLLVGGRVRFSCVDGELRAVVRGDHDVYVVHLTTAQIAKLLGFSPGTILDWFEAGRLPGFKVGRAVRFRESEVLDWLEERRVGPGTGGEVLPTPTVHPTRVVVSQALPTPLRGGTDAS